MAAPRTQEILARVGVNALRRTGSLFWVPGGIVTPTFTRNGTKRVRGVDGVGRKVAANKLAITAPAGLVDAAGNPLQGLMLERARTQLVADPENFGNWSLSGTPTRVGGQADPFGGTNAYKLGDDDGAVTEFLFENVGYTADAIKPLAIFLQADTAAQTVVRIQETTGPATRLAFTATWNAGVPTVSSVTGTQLSVFNWGGGWWLFLFQSTSITAGNTNRVEIYPAGLTGSAQGTVYAFGVNSWNAMFPSSYQGPGESPTVDDVLDLPIGYGSADIDMTVLARVARPPHADATGDFGNWPTILRMGNRATGAEWNLSFNKAARQFLSETFSDNVTSVSQTVAIPAGDPLEIVVQRQLVSGAPKVRLDAGSGYTAFGSTGIAAAAWGSQLMRIGDGGGGGLFATLLDVIVARGLFTRAEMEAQL